MRIDSFEHRKFVLLGTTQFKQRIDTMRTRLQHAELNKKQRTGLRRRIKIAESVLCHYENKHQLQNA